jgi:SAM-dependent methyltransferase
MEIAMTQRLIRHWPYRTLRLIRRIIEFEKSRWHNEQSLMPCGPMVLPLILLIAPTGLAQSTMTLDSPASTELTNEAKVPPPLDSYLGRAIAQTMHYTGAPWLIRDRREREERCSLMLANLGVKTGMAICDMGCGNGFHTLKLAEMTGPSGYVAGVDVQPQMLMLLRNRMEASGVENVVPILGSYHNPRLPRGSLDLILLVDVYHEFSHPPQMLAAMRKSLKPDGLIVLVEYRSEDPEVPIKPLHKMSKSQVDKELSANGFTLVRSFDKLPWQHMLFYGVSDRAE